MLIVLDVKASVESIRRVQAFLKDHGIDSQAHSDPLSQTIVAPNASKKLTVRQLEAFEDVVRAVPITSPYKYASIQGVNSPTVIEVAGLKIGDGSLSLVGGPCAVESRDQLFGIARYVAESGVKLFRAGAFKPRTSPYAFQGLGIEGLALLAEVKKEFSLGIVTECLDNMTFDEVEAVADIVQIGARNMQNFSLLKRAGRSLKPILLKRGNSASLDEWLLAAEYILSEGNSRVILCERGIRTWSDHSRNTLDLSVIPAARRLTHLPIFVDPSHAVGRRDSVLPCARASVAVGADGLLIETHCQPEQALSDGPQALLQSDYLDLVDQCREIHKLLQAKTALHLGF